MDGTAVGAEVGTGSVAVGRGVGEAMGTDGERAGVGSWAVAVGGTSVGSGVAEATTAVAGSEATAVGTAVSDPTGDEAGVSVGKAPASRVASPRATVATGCVSLSRRDRPQASRARQSTKTLKTLCFLSTVLTYSPVTIRPQAARNNGYSLPRERKTSLRGVPR
jgi:hypothetical protein